MTENLAALARRLHALHVAGDPLALANVWDVASARVVEEAGARAIATTSAGVAWSLGRPDGDRLDRADLVAAVRRITAAVRLPVTVDAEGGYGATPAAVATTMLELLDAGAVGVNLEDGTRPPAALAARVEASRGAADRAGVPLFVNARTDVFLRAVGDPEGRVGEVLERAAVYVAAGADGIFVPGLVDAPTIATLAAALPVPLNVMAGPGSPDVPVLARLGVARVSLGSGVAQAAYAVARRAAGEMLGTGTYAALDDALDHAALDGLLGAAGTPVADGERMTS